MNITEAQTDLLCNCAIPISQLSFQRNEEELLVHDDGGDDRMHRHFCESRIVVILGNRVDVAICEEMHILPQECKQVDSEGRIIDKGNGKAECTDRLEQAEIGWLLDHKQHAQSALYERKCGLQQPKLMVYAQVLLKLDKLEPLQQYVKNSPRNGK